MSISTLPDILRHHAHARGEKQALVGAEDGRSWTFAELNADANRVAAALTAAGVADQDRIAFLDKNGPEYFIYLYGGAKLGAVTVAVNWRLVVVSPYLGLNTNCGIGTYLVRLIVLLPYRV